MSSIIEESKNGAESAVLALHKLFLDADQSSADLLPINKKVFRVCRRKSFFCALLYSI